MIPIGILIYLILAIIRSFVILAIKKINDHVFISQNKILMIYGLMGAIISSIFCILLLFLIAMKEKFKIISVMFPKIIILINILIVFQYIIILFRDILIMIKLK